MLKRIGASIIILHAAALFAYRRRWRDVRACLSGLSLFWSRAQ